MTRPATLSSLLAALAIAGAATLAASTAQAQCVRSCTSNSPSLPDRQQTFQPAVFAGSAATAPAATSATFPISTQAPVAATSAEDSTLAPTASQDAASLAAAASGSALSAFEGLGSLFKDGETVSALGNLLEFLAGACSVFGVMIGWLATRRRFEKCRKNEA